MASWTKWKARERAAGGGRQEAVDRTRRALYFTLRPRLSSWSVVFRVFSLVARGGDFRRIMRFRLFSKRRPTKEQEWVGPRFSIGVKAKRNDELPRGAEDDIPAISDLVLQGLAAG